MHRPVLLLLACGLAACDATHDTPTPPSAMHHASMMRDVLPTPEQRRDMARLREVTAQFHSRAASDAAGYNFVVPGCFSDPDLGGMGFHFGKKALLDGVVEPDNPEFLLYEPTKSGGLQFVAVEYAVPFEAWTQSSPPEVFGIPFHRNEGAGLWIMHVWHIRENPSGAFFDWNPRVSCDNAAL